MSIVMEEEIKRWTARRKSALVLEVVDSPAIQCQPKLEVCG
ncbi:putative GIY-YIG superfamily endonuclease [Xanthomonas arboricola]|nr:putative GIY-YIG superfamily endonuclease [Xanthomonas euroxanthea]